VLVTTVAALVLAWPGPLLASALPAADGWARPRIVAEVPSDSLTLPILTDAGPGIAVFGRRDLIVLDQTTGATLAALPIGSRVLTPETWRNLAVWQDIAGVDVQVVVWDGLEVRALAALRTPSPRVSVIQTEGGIVLAWLELDEVVPRLSLRVRWPDGTTRQLAVADEFKTFSGPWLLPPGLPGERVRIAVLHGTAVGAEAFELEIFTVFNDGSAQRRSLGRTAGWAVAAPPKRVEAPLGQDVLLYSFIERGRPAYAVLLPNGRVVKAGFATGRFQAVELDAFDQIQAVWSVRQRRVIRFDREGGPRTVLSSPRAILDRSLHPERDAVLWRTSGEVRGVDQVWLADRSRPYTASLLERLTVSLGLDPWAPGPAIATNAAAALVLSLPIALALGMVVALLASAWRPRRPVDAAVAGVATATCVVAVIRLGAELAGAGPLIGLVAEVTWFSLAVGAALGVLVLAAARRRLFRLDTSMVTLLASAVQSLALVFPAVFTALAWGLGA